MKQTHDMYEEWAESYDDSVNNAGYKQPERCAKALKSLMEKDGPILDVGCGTGLAALALKDKGYTTIDGCDFSRGMLDKAETLGIYRRLFEADLNKPPLDIEAESYDAVTAVGVFSMLHVDVSAMDELIRAVKPGGFIIICLNEVFYNKGTLTAKLDALSAVGRINQLSHEHGEHLPDLGMTGWVIKLKKPV